MRTGPPGCVTVETLGSFFWIDDTLSRYTRLPKHEAPRERPEWSDERAGVLQDAVWHPMVAWRIGTVPADQAKFEAMRDIIEGDPERYWMVALRPPPSDTLIIECGHVDGEDRVIIAPQARRLD